MAKVSQKPKEEMNYEELVKHAAELVMMRLTEEEIKTFAPQMKDILNYVELLEKVDTEGLEETNQVTGLVNVLREDVVEDSLTQEEALSNAHATENGMFKVPGKLSNVDA